MSDEVVIIDARLADTENRLHDISEEDCRRSATFVATASMGHDSAQWGTETAAIVYSRDLTMQLRRTQSEIEDLCQRITTLAERINEARRHAQATDNEISEILTSQSNTLELNPQLPPPSASSFDKRLSSMS